MQAQTYYHPASQSQVEKELWVWRCIYHDGSELHQFNDTDHTFHNFKEINQQELATFKMRNTETNQEVTVLFPQGAKLIHFYRHATLEHGSPNERVVKLYCFGYEYGVINCKFVITPSNEIIFTDNFDRVEAA